MTEKTNLEKTRETKALKKQGKVETLATLLRSPETKAKLIEGAPKFFNEDALIRVALTSIQKNPKLLDCTPGSVIQALINCAYYGLVPESQTNEAHLVPFKDTCVLIVGYQGLIKMATNSGTVSHVEVAHVYENDHFDYQLGLDRKLEHKPAKTNRGEYCGSYVVVVYADDKKDFLYVSKEEGLAHGKRFSKTFNFKDSTWKTDTPSMCLKTAVRMIMKFIPKSPTSERLLTAIARDEQMERGAIIDVTNVEPKEEVPDPESTDGDPAEPTNIEFDKDPDNAALDAEIIENES